MERLLEARRRWYSDIREAHGASAPVVALRCSPGALPFHEPGDVLVEIELGSVDGETGRAGDPLREHGLGRPGPIRLPLWKVDHRLFGPAQVKGRPPPLHGLANGLHVGVGVLVKELQEEGEVVWVALVRRGGKQQQVVRAVAKELPQPVALALVRLIARRHTVGLVDYHQVPVRLPQSGKDVFALGEVERCDHQLLVNPLVDAGTGRGYRRPSTRGKRSSNFSLSSRCHWNCQVGGTDHEYALGKPSEFELADEQPCHDGLACPGVVGEQESHAGEFEEVFVYSLELVGQRIHSRDGQSEVWVELVGDAEGVGLEPEPQEPSVAIIGQSGVGDGQFSDVGRGQRSAPKPLRPLPDEACLDGIRTVRADRLHSHRLVEQRTSQQLSFMDP